MKKEVNIAEMKKIDDTDNVINLFDKNIPLLTAPKGPTGNDWLSGLPVGTVFLCSPKPEAPVSKIFLQEYEVKCRFTKAIKLIAHVEPEQPALVNPEEFCKFFDLFETLYTPEESDVHDL